LRITTKKLFKKSTESVTSKRKLLHKLMMSMSRQHRLSIMKRKRNHNSRNIVECPWMKVTTLIKVNLNSDRRKSQPREVLSRATIIFL